MARFTCQLPGPTTCVNGLYFKSFRACLRVNVLSNVRKILALSDEHRTCLLVVGSAGMKNAVADTEFELPREEEDTSRDKSSPITERILPPWGGSGIIEDSNLEPSVANQPKNAPEEKPALNVDSVHFLEETDEETLSKRVLELSRTNKPRSALELVRSMELSGLCPDAHSCNSLLACLMRNGLVEDGLSMFESMKVKKMTTGHTYSLLLKAVADARGCDAALRMFGEMEEESEFRGDFDQIVYNTVISICGRANDWHEALRLWRSMTESGLSGTRVTYSVLVCTFVRCGQNELALDAYNDMVQAKFDPGIDTIQAVIGACAKEGRWALALCAFESALERELKPNAIACNALMNLLGKAGEIESAFQVFETMKSFGHPPDSYTWHALLGALRRGNRHGDALCLFESIEERGSRVDPHLYNVALVSCSKLGLWGRALQLLWKMEADGVTVSTASYNLAISACEAARKADVALQVYTHMVGRKCTPDTFTRLLLIRICVWASLWDEVDEILSGAPDASVYNAAIQGMCLRGRTESAKKLYAKLRDLGLEADGKTRALMLQNLRKKTVKHRYRYRYRYGQRYRPNSK